MRNLIKYVAYRLSLTPRIEQVVVDLRLLNPDAPERGARGTVKYQLETRKAPSVYHPHLPSPPPPLSLPFCLSHDAAAPLVLVPTIRTEHWTVDVQRLRPRHCLLELVSLTFVFLSSLLKMFNCQFSF